jgi:hypothetical protein
VSGAATSAALPLQICPSFVQRWGHSRLKAVNHVVHQLANVRGGGKRGVAVPPSSALLRPPQLRCGAAASVCCRSVDAARPTVPSSAQGQSTVGSEAPTAQHRRSHASASATARPTALIAALSATARTSARANEMSALAARPAKQVWPRHCAPVQGGGVWPHRRGVAARGSLRAARPRRAATGDCSLLTADSHAPLDGLGPEAAYLLDGNVRGLTAQRVHCTVQLNMTAPAYAA